jgi:hypothetical protein
MYELNETLALLVLKKPLFALLSREFSKRTVIYLLHYIYIIYYIIYIYLFFIYI